VADLAAARLLARARFRAAEARLGHVHALYNAYGRVPRDGAAALRQFVETAYALQIAAARVPLGA
jgi:predicted DNA-binding WGR domain protein